MLEGKEVPGELWGFSVAGLCERSKRKLSSCTLNIYEYLQLENYNLLQNLRMCSNIYIILSYCDNA